MPSLGRQVAVLISCITLTSLPLLVQQHLHALLALRLALILKANRERITETNYHAQVGL